MPIKKMRSNVARTRKALRQLGIEPELEFSITNLPWNYYSEGIVYINPNYIEDLDIYLHEAGHWFADNFELLDRSDFAKRFGEPLGCVRYEIRRIKDLLGFNNGFDPDKHISQYAAVSPEEDWCECFIAILSGENPNRYPRTIRSKLRYVQRRIKAERE